MKYNVEEVEKKIHVAQLDGIGERLEEDIRGILGRTGMYFRIFHRAKTPVSIVNKLERGGYGYGEGEKKLQDLVGLRVVVYYYDDRKIIQKIMDETFCREGIWSVTDTTEEEFKASKLNGVFRIPEEYQRLYNGDITCVPAELTFEVQLRTVFFEGWHEIEHDMRYKSPYGDKFWKDNEDLSRTLNSVLANLELCDWSTVTVFDQLSYYHFTAGNWEMMLKGRFRLRFAMEPLSEEVVHFLDENEDVAYCLYRCSREKVLFALLGAEQQSPITYNQLVKVANESVADYDHRKKKRLARICGEVTSKSRLPRGERTELNPLEVTPTFTLNVVLCHSEGRNVNKEFMSAVQLIASWARSRFRNVANDIPDTPVDYELHVAGYNLKILGDVSLGIYKLDLDYVDTTRKGVIWHTNVSLERGDQIRMKVRCDYGHPPDRLVRDCFSKPRFIDEIFRRMGYRDVIPLSLKPRRIRNLKDMEELSQFIQNPSRTLPVIVAVEDEDPERQINVARLTETVGTYAHVYLLEKRNLSVMVQTSDYTEEELMGAVWVTFRDGEDKFFTREMIADSRFDFNKYAYDRGNVYEKAFRHKLVRLIKEKNC